MSTLKQDEDCVNTITEHRQSEPSIKTQDCVPVKDCVPVTNLQTSEQHKTVKTEPDDDPSVGTRGGLETLEGDNVKSTLCSEKETVSVKHPIKGQSQTLLPIGEKHVTLPRVSFENEVSQKTTFPPKRRTSGVKPFDNQHEKEKESATANNQALNPLFAHILPSPSPSSQINGSEFLDFGSGFDWYLVRPRPALSSSSNDSPLCEPDGSTLSSKSGSETYIPIRINDINPQRLQLLRQSEQVGEVVSPSRPYVKSILSPLRHSEPLTVIQVDETTHQVSPRSCDEKACRICQEDDAKERLASPCLCSGTIGFVHISCLNTWLQATSRTSCELCGCSFPVTRKPAPFRDFLRNPRANMDLPNLLLDMACLVVLTPLLLSSVYLSSTGALKYETLGRRGSVCAVITLLTALILVYISWAALAILYHLRIWQVWREKHGRVSALEYGQVCDAAGKKITTTGKPAVAVRKPQAASGDANNPPKSLMKGKDVHAEQDLSSDSDNSESRSGDKAILLNKANRLSEWIHVNNRISAEDPTGP